MATWKELDSELGFNKDEAGDESNAGMGLVATIASEAELDTDSEDENEVYSKVSRE